jgi:hypothetical protein
VDAVLFATTRTFVGADVSISAASSAPLTRHSAGASLCEVGCTRLASEGWDDDEHLFRLSQAAVSRCGSFQPGRGKWQVSPSGWRWK